MHLLFCAPPFVFVPSQLGVNGCSGWPEVWRKLFCVRVFVPCLLVHSGRISRAIFSVKLRCAKRRDNQSFLARSSTPVSPLGSAPPHTFGTPVHHEAGNSGGFGEGGARSGAKKVSWRRRRSAAVPCNQDTETGAKPTLAYPSSHLSSNSSGFTASNFVDGRPDGSVGRGRRGAEAVAAAEAAYRAQLGAWNVCPNVPCSLNFSPIKSALSCSVYDSFPLFVFNLFLF